jgi:hypothetical protein
MAATVALAAPHVGASPAGSAVAQTSAVQPAAAPAATSKPHKKTLMILYWTKSDQTCTVYPNYPKAGVLGNTGRTWSIAPHNLVVWRYNVNKTWAMIADRSPTAPQFPHWGFTLRSCIGLSKGQKLVQGGRFPAGLPIPNRVLQGRSQNASGWRAVRFSLKPAAIVARHVRVRGTSTLRDAAGFVTGNVFPDWHVDVTAVTRGKGSWVEVYVPNAKRWGYVDAADVPH